MAELYKVTVVKQCLISLKVEAESGFEAEEKVRKMYSEGSIRMDEGVCAVQFFSPWLTRDDIKDVAERLDMPDDEQSLDEYFSVVQDRYFYESQVDPTASWDLIVEYIITSI